MPKDFAHCGCQAFVPSSADELKCKYCDHYNAFHKPKTSSNSNIIQPINNALNLLSQIPTSTPATISSSTVNSRQFVTLREEVLANFQPQNLTPYCALILNPNSRRHNNRSTNRSSANSLAHGHPRNISLQLNHILLL
jgi:hypothetical protein